jgi:hypothetical protein
MAYCFWSQLIYMVDPLAHIITNMCIELLFLSKKWELITTLVIGIFPRCNGNGSKPPTSEVCMDLSTSMFPVSLSGQPHKTETKYLNLNLKTEPQNLNFNHKIQLHECHQWIWGLGPCGCLNWNCMQEQVHSLCGCFILDCMQEQVDRTQYQCLILKTMWMSHFDLYAETGGMKTMWILLLECIAGTGWYKTIWMFPWVHGKVVDRLTTGRTGDT